MQHKKKWVVPDKPEVLVPQRKHAEFTAGLRGIKMKGGKVAALKDNIRIQWKGLGCMECETRWTVDGHELTDPKLAN